MKALRLFLVCVLVTSASAAFCDVAVYSYAGNWFQDFYTPHPPNPWTTNNRIIASFTVPAPLLNSNYGVQLTPLTYSISDGVFTLTPTNSSADVFRISSNSSGQIVDWLIVVVASAILNDNSISTASVTNVDQATDVYFNTAKNSTAGSWRMSIVPTPEPASLITLSFGLVMTAVRRVRLL